MAMVAKKGKRAHDPEASVVDPAAPQRGSGVYFLSLWQSRPCVVAPDPESVSGHGHDQAFVV